MKRKNILGWANLMLISSALLGLACGGSHDVESEATVHTINASVATVERLDAAQEVEVFGTVEAEQTAAVSVRVMAMVTSVRVKAGDEVKKGQLLLEIDPQASEGQLSQARGGLGQAEAALALAGIDAPLKAIASAELALPARRPAYSVLDTGRYHGLGLPSLRPWREALADCLVGPEPD